MGKCAYKNGTSIVTNYAISVGEDPDWLIKQMKEDKILLPRRGAITSFKKYKNCSKRNDKEKCIQPRIEEVI